MEPVPQQKDVYLNNYEGHFAVHSLLCIEHALAEISRLADAGKPIPAAALRSALKNGEEGVQGLFDVFRDRMDPVFFNERCKLTTGAIVHKTFAIPELLEMVLLNLNVRTLLVAQCLNRRFFEAIRDSHRLQQKMALRKTANPYFSTILVEHLSAHRGNLFYHLDVSGTGREGGYKKMFHPENPPVVEMDFTIYFSERPLPSIGSRIRRMLVCEPIITEMSVQPSCCAPWKRTDFFQIINRSGVTFGDIHDAIERVLKGHRLCLEGPSRRDSGGYLTALHATIAVRPDDPTARRTLDEWKARAAGKGQRIGTSMSGRSVEDGPETEELRPESEDESSETVHAYEDAGRAKVVKKLCF